MGITVRGMRAAVNTSTGNQDFTTAACGGLTPKAVIAIMTKGVTDGTVAVHGALSIGAATGTANEWSAQCQAEDAQGTTDTDRRMSTTLVAMLDNNGALVGVGEFVAFIADGVTINWSNAMPAAYLLTLVFFCGTDLSAFASTFDPGNTLNLETVVTGVGFQPVNLFVASSFVATLDTDSQGDVMSFGVVHDDGAGTTRQRSVGYRNINGSATVAMAAHYSTLYGLTSLSTTGTVTCGGEFDNFDTDGFSAFTRIAGAGGADIGYLALAYGGVVDSALDDIQTPTSTGNDSETFPAFTPQFVMLGLSMLVSVNAATATDNANSAGIGVFTATEAFSNAVWDDDGAADSDSEQVSDDLPVNIQNGVDGTGLAASFVSMNADGWTLNYSDVEAAAKLQWAWAIEAADSGITGAAEITLGALTTSATGVLPVAGMASVTLGALTTSATGALPVVGAASITLGALTVAATGTLPIAGAASVTLTNLTTTATGALAASGVVSITLAPLTTAATGVLPLAGSAAITLAALTTTATATLAMTGAAAITLDPVMTTAAGAVSLAGAASLTLDALTLVATGAGLVSTFGAADITLDGLTLSAAGALSLAGASSTTLEALTTNATGALAIAGAASLALDALTLTADGIGLVSALGAADIALDGLTLSATGALPLVGASSTTLDALTISATSALAIAGAANLTLAPLTITAAGVAAVAGQGAGVLDALMLSASGTSLISAQAVIVLGALLLAAAGSGSSGLVPVIRGPTRAILGSNGRNGGGLVHSGRRQSVLIHDGRMED